MSFGIYTGTNTEIDIFDPSTYNSSQTVTSGQIPTITLNKYIAIGVEFTKTDRSQTPTLKNFVLNFDRGDLLQTYGKYSNQDINTLNDEESLGDFLELTSRNYYLQKRLKNGVNFPVIREYTSEQTLFGVTSNGLTYKPKRKQIIKDIGTDTTFIQFKFSEDLLDNQFKLFKFSPTLIQRKLREQ